MQVYSPPSMCAVTRPYGRFGDSTPPNPVENQSRYRIYTDLLGKHKCILYCKMYTVSIKIQIHCFFLHLNTIKFLGPVLHHVLLTALFFSPVLRHVFADRSLLCTRPPSRFTDGLVFLTRPASLMFFTNPPFNRPRIKRPLAAQILVEQQVAKKNKKQLRCKTVFNV